MEFHVGDRVEFVGNFSQNGGKICPGQVGTVAAIRSSSSLTVGVEWDEKIGTHNLGGKCKMGHGWWLNRDQLAFYKDESFESASDAELMQLLFGK